MMAGKITVIGLGPGNPNLMTPAATEAIRKADTIIGYNYYFQFIESIKSPNADCIDTGMKKEVERARIAFEKALEGKIVAVISSGDSGIYGMAPLIYEMQVQTGETVDLEVIPGISAFQAAAARLGAPVSHDFCVISLSDLMTPWAKIEGRIQAAAQADFVTAIYNPKSKGRYWQIYRLKEIFEEYRSPDTPIGIARQVGREEEELTIVPLKDFDPECVDMFTVLIIGNSQTFIAEDKMITPRGYYREEDKGHNQGQSIMINSFRTIHDQLKNQDIELGKKWALLHCIHTSADFEMEDILYADQGAIASWHELLNSDNPPAIITDVTMVVSGVRKAAIERLGLTVKCYLQDERVAQMAKEKSITRTQAGIRLAVEEHPNAIFAFGNAPTALIELTEQVRKGKAQPSGIIAAPVGFVNVVESKHRVKTFKSVPKVIIEGRKGGSNLAATIVNAALAYNDAEALKPGREV
ncbi:precorrin-3B C(17)-methyltransferase [Puteibacter caeruleilacunae]|nr:precorrin-3B C(17)-methyltransferase [Puteibacter caeruleilacunae]